MAQTIVTQEGAFDLFAKRDIASGLFNVAMHGVASGVASTPFSATV